RSDLFPYTTLFRSVERVAGSDLADQGHRVPRRRRAEQIEVALAQLDVALHAEVGTDADAPQERPGVALLHRDPDVDLVGTVRTDRVEGDVDADRRLRALEEPGGLQRRARALQAVHVEHLAGQHAHAAADDRVLGALVAVDDDVAHALGRAFLHLVDE